MEAQSHRVKSGSVSAERHIYTHMHAYARARTTTRTEGSTVNSTRDWTSSSQMPALIARTVPIAHLYALQGGGKNTARGGNARRHRRWVLKDNKRAGRSPSPFSSLPLDHAARYPPPVALTQFPTSLLLPSAPSFPPLSPSLSFSLALLAPSARCIPSTECEKRITNELERRFGVLRIPSCALGGHHRTSCCPVRYPVTHATEYFIPRSHARTFGRARARAFRKDNYAIATFALHTKRTYANTRSAEVCRKPNTKR